MPCAGKYTVLEILLDDYIYIILKHGISHLQKHRRSHEKILPEGTCGCVFTPIS